MRNLSNWAKGDPCNSNWTGIICFGSSHDDGHFHVRELYVSLVLSLVTFLFFFLVFSLFLFLFSPAKVDIIHSSLMQCPGFILAWIILKILCIDVLTPLSFTYCDIAN